MWTEKELKDLLDSFNYSIDLQKGRKAEKPNNFDEITDKYLNEEGLTRFRILQQSLELSEDKGNHWWRIQL